MLKSFLESLRRMRTERWFGGRGLPSSRRDRQRRAASRFTESLEVRELLASDLSQALQSAVLGGSNSVNQMVDALHDRLFDDVLSQSQPLIGTALKLKDTASDQLNALATKFFTAMQSLQSLPQPGSGDLQQALFDQLRSLMPTIPNAAAIPVLGDKATEVSVRLPLQGVIVEKDVPFNPALPFVLNVTNGNVRVAAGYATDVILGFSTTDGPFLDLSSDEDVRISLSVTSPNLNVIGRLGILKFTATNAGAPDTGLTATLGVNLSDGSDAGTRLTASEISSLGITATINGTAAINLNLKAEMGNDDRTLPSIRTNLKIDWPLSGSVSTPLTSRGIAPTIEFKDVRINVGEFFANTVRPIFERIAGVLDPLQPVFEVLTTPMPVLSDLAPLRAAYDSNGDGTVTLVEALEVSTGEDLTLIQALADLQAVSNFVDTLAASGDMLLGSFQAGSDMRVTPGVVAPLSNVNEAPRTNSDVNTFITKLKVPSFDGKFSFPIIEDPKIAFRMLLGQDIEVFKLDFPDLNAGFELGAFVPVLGPLGVHIRGRIDVGVRLGFGYDTSGLRRWAEHGFKDEEAGLVWDGFYIRDHINGEDVQEVYVEAGVTVAPGVDIGIAGGGIGGTLIANVGLDLRDRNNDGRLRPQEIVENLKEHGPFCGLFEFGGSFDAALTAYVRLGYGRFAVEESYDIARTQLLDFTFGCYGNAPRLAELDTTTHTLKLNVGPRGYLRGSHPDSVADSEVEAWRPNESLTLRRLFRDELTGYDVIEVSGFGFRELHAGVAKIEGNGGLGNDVIQIQRGVTAEILLEGGAGNDLLMVADHGGILLGGDGDDELGGLNGLLVIGGGRGNDLIHGGPQADIITAGDGDDIVFGHGGDDYINGDLGNDLLIGGDGDDEFLGGEGHDDLRGNAGNDKILGEEGNDILRGDAGDNELWGGDGDDLITTSETVPAVGVPRDGANLVYGGAGNDTILTGSGVDRIFAEGGNDHVSAGPGADVVSGGDDHDVLIGGAGNDEIYGAAGDDQISGDVDPARDTFDWFAVDGTDRDVIYAGAGFDVVNGGADDDLIFGEAGDDNLRGGFGVDTIYGAAGIDEIYGDDGDDELYGDDDHDYISGGTGLDRIRGGLGDDWLDGDSGHDAIFGEAGHDVVSGGSGDDLIEGATGDDELAGDTGADRISGGEGDDELFGQSRAGTGDDNAVDELFGDAGNDWASGGGGDDVLYGATGVDVLHGNDGHDRLFAGTGIADALFGGRGDDLLIGSEDGAVVDPDFNDLVFFGDIITGGEGNDTIHGLGGADTIFGDDGDDTVDSGAGSDFIRGGNGNDVLYAGVGYGERIEGEAGDDVIYGSDLGPDVLLGGPGHDRLFGQGFNDTLFGGDGDDELDGGAGRDELFGEDGSDTLHGGGGVGDLLDGGNGSDVLNGSDDGADIMRGGAGRDTAYGRGGNDSLDGGSDDDILEGGDGDDLLVGGAGSDLLIGGAQHDTLYGHSESGTSDDVAVDFLYGDFGTNRNELNSGRDRLFGQAGNDRQWGEGDDDFLDAGAGNSQIADYGSGESATPSDFVTPPPTAPPTVLPRSAITWAGSTLASGTETAGRWSELGVSGTGGGISRSPVAAVELTMTIDATGIRYAAWADARSGNFEIYVAKYVIGQGWLELPSASTSLLPGGSAREGGVSNTPESSRRPSLAIGADNRPIVAWTEGAGGGSDIRVAKFDPTAFSGAGGWVALGSSLSILGISGTGAADDPQLINTISGPVVAWLDSSVIGRTNVFVKRFDGANWNGLGGAANASSSGLTGSTGRVAGFSIATDGHRVVVAWTQPNAVGSDIHLTEYNTQFWAPQAGSTTDQGVSQKPGRNQMPAVAYLGDDIFVAWQGDAAIRPEIFARTFKRDGGTWQSIGHSTTGVSQTQGLASEPQLVSRGGKLTLAWIDDARANRRGLGQSVFVAGWNGTAFVPDAGADQLPGGITSTQLVHELTLTADAVGRPQIGWTSPARTVNGIASQQVFLRADLMTSGGRRFVAGGGTTVQYFLDAFDLEPGDRIDVVSDTAGFDVSLQDSGVTIVGLPNVRITSQVTVTNATDVVLQSMQFDGSVLVNGGSRITIADSKLNVGTTITGTADAHFVRNVVSGPVTGLALDGTLRPVVRANTFIGAEGVRLFGAGSTDIIVRENTIRSANGISIETNSTGLIGDNEIANAQTGITIIAGFGGVIERNDIHHSTVGIAYSAAAALSNNRIRLNTTGVVASVSNAVSALGFVASSLRPVVLPNDISDNVVGVRLSGGRMQSQIVRRNGIGVTGSGELVATDFEHANTIERNTLGVDLNGPVQFNRILSNSIGIAATNGQLIAHNVISRNTQTGIRVTGRTDVRVVNNTLYSPVGDLLVAEQNSRELFVSGNVFWTEAGTALKIDNSSQTGFWSDFNLLHASGTGKLVSWSGFEFTDILDWQADVGLFDLHSHGRTVVNPGWSEPGFISRATDDLRTTGLKAQLRFSDPTVNAADPIGDLGLPAASLNLLSNSSFENGRAGWTTNPEAAATPNQTRAFDGAIVLSAGNAPTGFAAQDVDLSAYTAADLDSGRLTAVFSGRIRAAAEAIPDTGRVLLRFYDAGNQLLGETVADSVVTTDRWSLQGGAIVIPAGSRRIQYRFESVRHSGLSNDAYLDGTVLRIQAEHVAPDAGAFGNTHADLVAAGATTLTAPQLALRSPDLYTDVERDQLHTIHWESFGNTTNRAVRIDVFCDGLHGPEFLVNVAAAASDTGSFEWMPAAFGIGYGTPGLRIQIQLAGDEIVLDRSTEPFSVVENTTTYFVNDRAVANDEWTSAAGNNRFTGRLSSSPKPLPGTILRTYTLTAASTLYLDSGEYRMFQPLVVSNTSELGDDEGFLFTGPTSVARVAKLSHANPLYTPFPILTLDDADEMRLTRFSTDGGTHGLLIHNGSERVTASDVKIRGASSDGLRFESSAVGSTFARITAQNNVGAGLRVTGPIDSIRQSEVQLNQSAGIALDNPGDVVLTQNLVAGNYGTGIFVSGGTPTIGNTDLVLSLGNRVLNNRLDGIVVTDTLAGIVAGNTVSGHGAGAGIRFGGLIQNNVASGNSMGIDGSVVLGNRVYSSGTGIELRAFGLPTLAADNVVYSNSVGMIVNARTQSQLVQNNLLYANSLTALEVRGAVQVINNTIQAAGYGIRAVANPVPVSDLQLRNNIIVATGTGIGISIPSSSQTGFVSDFNLIHAASTSARIGEWQGLAHATLRSWQQATFADSQSLTASPLFVDADGADNVLGAGTSSDGRDDNFHESSEFGSVKGGGLAPVIGVLSGRPEFQAAVFSNDSTISPALDRGAATDGFANEPTPNGNYINLGAYGNTVEASRSPLTYVLVTSPNGEEVWPGNQTFPIRWRAESLTGNVRIELLDSDFGFRAVIADVTPNDGEFLWTVPPELAADDHQIRITRLDATGAVDDSDDLFATTAAIRSYYVNDGFADGDAIPAEWTTVAGNDANDGLSPATPKASIRAILDAYDLGPDDVILVDVGTYNLTANIVIAAQDSGVEIRGYHTTTFGTQQNPIGEDTHLRANLNRGNQAAGSYVFQFTGADDVTLSHLGITGANIGVVALNGADSDRITIRSSEFRSLAAGGVLIEASNDAPQLIGNRVSEFVQYGLRLTATNAATVRDNVVFATNTTGSFGIDVTSEFNKPEGNLVEANHVYAVGTGIRTVAGSTTAGMTVRGNRVHDTRTTGISGGGVDVIDGNTVYDNQAIGISASYVSGNTVFGNQTGIQGGTGILRGNRVYRNVTGIAGGSSSLIADNRVYTNTRGLDVSGGTTRNNLVYDNTADEILASFGSTIQNNTIHHSAGGNAIRVRSTNARLLNNIIQVDSGTAIVVEAAGQSGFSSNYNLLHLDDDTLVGLWGTTAFGSLADWTDELGLDRNSRLADPMFADDDYRTLAGSPAIDFGDPASAYALEPVPHGGRVNAGHTGNTAAAAVSDSEVVQLLAPNGREKLEQGSDVSLRWRSHGLTDPRGTYSEIIAADSPLAFYRLGEQSGTVAADSSGNGRTGTYFGSPILGAAGAMAAEADTAMRIASTNGGVSIPYSAAMSPVQLSVEAWINPDTSISTFNNVITRSNFGNAADGYGLMWYSDKLRFHVNSVNGAGVVDVTVAKNQWSHIAATSDGSTLRVYLNGVLAGSTNYTTPINYVNYQTTIGGSWRGGLDDVALYDHALTPTQIAAHYQRGSREVYGTVKIEAYRAEQPDLVQLIAESTPNDGLFVWTVPPALAVGEYQLRVSLHEGLQAHDLSDGDVQVVPGGNHYYINDGSLTEDVFSTAAGNNAHSGKSPDQPMASLAALLAAYDLDAGDVIHVDAGTYQISGTLVISAQDSGVRIQGPQAIAGSASSSHAVLNRGSAVNTSAILFDLQNADDVTIEGLTLTNAFKAIFASANSDSDRLTVGNNRITGNATGVELSSTNDSAVVSGSVFTGNSAAIVGLSVSGLSVLQNTIQATTGTAIRITTNGDVAAVWQNQISGGSTAIDVTGYFTVADNTILNPTSSGILASASSGLSTITANRITGTGSVNSTGIRLQGATASDNVIVSMGRGIEIPSFAIASDNRILNSSVAGIQTDAGTVRGNVVYSNAIGLILAGGARAENNLLYDNGNDGIWVRAGSGTVIENNTIAQASTGDAIQIGGAHPEITGAQPVSGVTLRNNILLAGSGYALNIAADSELGFSSDFNLFHMPANGKVVKWEDREFQLRTEWMFATGFDQNSRQGEPQFVNPLGADGILGYRTSDARDYGADDDFRVQTGSISVDAGATTSTSSFEPAPNGGRINLGHTGNTSLATISPERTVQLLSPNGLEKLEAGVPVTIRWRSDGLRNGGVTNPTVNLEITRDAGGSWFTLATSLPVDADGNGSFVWTPPGVSNGNEVLLRVTANVIGSPQDESDAGFLITNNDRHFYINDFNQSADVFTTQVGSDANSGKTPAQPMLTLAALLRAYDLEPGDVIHVDAGTYRVYSNIVLTSQDSGVRMEGPGATPEGRVLQSVALFNRGNTLPGSSVFELSGIDDASIDNLSLTGAESGIFASTTADSDRIQITNNTVFNNLKYGINIEAGIAQTHSEDAILRGNRVSNHTGASSAGIRVRSIRARIESNEVFGNQDGIQVFSDPIWTTVRTVISGNIAHDNLRYGITATELVQVIGNTAFGQSAVGAAGIFVSTSLLTTEVTDNVVHSNTIGIRGFSEVSGFNPPGVLQIRNNRAFNNGRGIQAHRWTRVDGNQVFSNGIGISGESTNGFNGTIVNNVVYANTNQGIFIERSSASGGQIVNNTILQLVGDAIRIDNTSQGLTIRNNILVVDAGRAIVVSSNSSQTGIVSNSNLFVLAASANAGFWNNANQSTLTQWQTATSQDSLSLTGDPRFVDRDGADNILGYDSLISRDGSLDDNFHLMRESSAIDRANGSAAPATDRDGRTRLDDPGTTNAGTPVASAFTDIGAYEFPGSSLDVIPPTVVSSEIITAGTIESPMHSLAVTFSEAMDSIALRGQAAWDLRSAGPNAVFGDADDIILPLMLRSGQLAHQAVFDLTGVTELPAGNLGLTIRGDSGPADLSGNALDGNADGAAGGNWVRTNHAPRLNVIPDVTGAEHTLIRINAVATDEDSGQSLAWSLESGAPAGAVIDPATGLFEWTPGEHDGGSVWNVTIRVTDNSDLQMSHQRTVRIVVGETNAAPIITAVGEQTLRQGGTLTVQLAATDSDAPVQQLTWGLSPSAPIGASVDPTTGLLTWSTGVTIVPGRYEIPVFVFDNGALPAAQNAAIVVTITAPERPIITGPVGTIESHYPLITWSPVTDAIGYEVWISSFTTGASPLILTTTQDTMFVSEQPLGIGRYRVWVRTLFENDVKSLWSAPRDFKISVQTRVHSIERRQITARPVISWQDVPGAVRYDIWVNNLSTGTDQYVRNQNLTDTSWTPEADLPLGTYRLWVRAIDAAGVATRWSMFTEVIVATAPALTTPGAATFDRTPEFTWQPVVGAESYEIQVRHRPSGVTIHAVAGVTATNWTPPADLSAGFYRWWVQAKSAQGILSYWSPGQNVYIGGRPVTLTPVGAESSSTPLFSWSPVDGAVRYELWVTDMDRVQRVIHLTNLTATSFTPTTPLQPSTYRVWVRAVSSADEVSPWSVVVEFVIGNR